MKKRGHRGTEGRIKRACRATEKVVSFSSLPCLVCTCPQVDDSHLVWLPFCRSYISGIVVASRSRGSKHGRAAFELFESLFTKECFYCVIGCSTLSYEYPLKSP